MMLVSYCYLIPRKAYFIFTVIYPLEINLIISRVVFMSLYSIIDTYQYTDSCVFFCQLIILEHREQGGLEGW